MNERAKALAKVIQDTIDGRMVHSDAMYPHVARAICEHLGLTWELQDHVQQISDAEIDQGCEGCQGQLAAANTAKLLATLLEAAGIPRPEPTPDLTHRPGRAI